MTSLRTTTLKLSACLSLAAAIVACGGENGDDTRTNDSAIAACREDGTAGKDQGSASLEAGQFKLYPSADVVPSVDCDKHTLLVLSASGEATLVEALEGVCEIVVEPNERTYPLQVGAADECGTRTLHGSRTNSDGSSAEVTITDNRGRMCTDEGPDFHPAPKLIVQETALGVTTTLYTLAE